ncbi:mediator of RNA polymerase II transcription subunit 31-like [Zingiber officinale]|uniref:mediator of RNA polymerase II transcription subunit 31-like n=1 Tax=Zingiber officinale TaxID=94328 RepID=UPI001C4BFE41|nr:mediator of RNA polymerase II transcription subunit 31-like [Zingiber officinale]XP_042394107.1 mediator of RNA polymerase II transcription subunit 31-like [Zingiber officinale]XP_042394108.1 mediator of RNA polymerase II transcription subunit 31-like [Zingiber officinale]
MTSSKDDVDQPTDSYSLLKNPYKDPDDGRQRFLLELEFVQCLANPTYIHYLAQNRYFEDEAFIGYLKYLQYWQRPEYIKFIMYPHCLFFLELLQNANFRNAMAHPGSKELAHRQQYYFWKNYRNNRLKHILPRPLPEPPAGPAPAPLPTAAPVPTSAPVPNAAPSLTPISAPLLASMPPMSSGPVHSPMQFVGQPGSAASAISKSDMRNAMGDRRKRKKED